MPGEGIFFFGFIWASAFLSLSHPFKNSDKSP